jgi:Saxitoxin biosynthesis operon protein SxtJ
MKRRETHAFHEDFAREQPVTGGSERSFGLVIAAFLAAIALRPLLHDVRAAPSWWALVAAAAFLLIAFAAPAALRPLNRLWTRLGVLLSRLVTPIVLALLFYGVVTPVAAMMRLLGKDPLKLRPAPETDSYWIMRPPPGPPPSSMKQQF